MKKTNQKGFTLIEVVLVLAIGGLIFLLAFLAFQQVSRNRRDTQRRADLDRVVAELQNYAGDNNGNYPSVGSGPAVFSSGTSSTTAPEVASFFASYMGGANFKNPNNGTYSIVSHQGATNHAILVAASTPGRAMWYVRERRCGGDLFATTGSAGDVAIATLLESGDWACREVQ